MAWRLATGGDRAEPRYTERLYRTITGASLTLELSLGKKQQLCEMPQQVQRVKIMTELAFSVHLLGAKVCMKSFTFNTGCCL